MHTLVSGIVFIIQNCLLRLIFLSISHCHTFAHFDFLFLEFTVPLRCCPLLHVQYTLNRSLFLLFLPSISIYSSLPVYSIFNVLHTYYVCVCVSLFIFLSALSVSQSIFLLLLLLFLLLFSYICIFICVATVYTSKRSAVFLFIKKFHLKLLSG